MGAVEDDERRARGLFYLFLSCLAVLLPPLVLFLNSLVRDPSLPIVGKLLWMRARELVGFPAPDEQAFLRSMKRERNEALRQAAASKVAKKGPAPGGLGPIDRFRARFFSRGIQGGGARGAMGGAQGEAN
jgi:hypothetical protein